MLPFLCADMFGYIGKACRQSAAVMSDICACKARPTLASFWVMPDGPNNLAFQSLECAGLETDTSQQHRRTKLKLRMLLLYSTCLTRKSGSTLNILPEALSKHLIARENAGATT